MSLKERYQNPVTGDQVNLRLFTYNSNNRTDFNNVTKVEIYLLDPNSKTIENPSGKVLVETIENITHVETGQYLVTLSLEDTKYVIGDYLDVWYVEVEENETEATIENNWQIYPDLWYTTPIPIIYDFNFSFRPNKIRQGSKRYLIINITPNVPDATDLQRYYENLAIVSPLKISIEKLCGDCVPAEQDLRIVVEQDSVELREKNTGYYFLDTTEMDQGTYNVWFELEFGESLYISDKSQLQIF